MFDQILGSIIQPLIWVTELTQSMSRTRDHEHLMSKPVPYEAYLQQSDAMAVGGHGNERREMEEQGVVDPRKGRAGFECRT